MVKLMALSMHEPVQVDAGRLAEIMNELGETAAQTIISAALEQLAETLTEARAAAMSGDMARLAECGELLSRLAWQIGLPTLAGVAVDVMTCAERRDAVGLAATMARLIRTGNRSLTEIWDSAAPVGR